VLLSQGYALAASAFRAAGWATKEGVQDTVALTSYFRDYVGNPKRIIVYGNSFGGGLTLELIEKHFGLYDGAIALCAWAAGAPETYDSLLSFCLAYSAAFGWPSEWGSIGDIRDDLSYDFEVAPLLSAQLATPENSALWEFVRLVTHTPPDWFYSMAFGAGATMSLATEARAELEVRAGGPIAENLCHLYDLNAEDRDYLAGLGLDEGSINTLLSQMDAERYEAHPSSRNYVKHYAEFEGKLRRPVLTMSTRADSFYPPTQQNAYFDKVRAAGREELLVQVFVNRNIHCWFSLDQILMALDGMEYWLDTGTAPDATFFPAGAGFLPDFEPEPWIWSANCGASETVDNR
jgi:pimeloyl-ACP methyl ester carboxylesterase